LIVGGSFTHAGSTPVNNIAYWFGGALAVDPTPAIPGGGVDGPVLTLAVASGDVLAGGMFTNAGGQLSPFAARAVAPGSPSITSQPSSVTVHTGGNASFSMSAAAGAPGVPLYYQWFRNGSPISPGPTSWGSVYSTPWGNNIQIANVHPSDAGNFWCVV